jgi:hypothetical protein
MEDNIEIYCQIRHPQCMQYTADGAHDRGDDVLVNREWSRVEGHTKERNVRQIVSPCSADRVSKKQGDNLFERVGST